MMNSPGSNTELKYWYLRNHKLFKVLNNTQVEQLCIVTGFKKARKGEIIYLSSTNTPRIFLLKKGNIKIVGIDDHGNETIKEILQKGDLFGELSLDTNAGDGEYAEALTNDVVICSFLLTDFERMMVENPHLALSYTKFVGFQLKRLKNNYSNLVFKDAKSRLYTFLKDWATKEGVFDGQKVTLKNYLTQEEISQIICTSRQTTVQLLNEMERMNILAYKRKEIVINDINLLH
jgi:CRP-like cAMP-binding protein